MATQQFPVFSLLVLVHVITTSSGLIVYDGQSETTRVALTRPESGGAADRSASHAARSPSDLDRPPSSTADGFGGSESALERITRIRRSSDPLDEPDESGVQRRSFFRSDLGKRPHAASTDWDVDDLRRVAALEKRRSSFRSDLGKRRVSGFRSDLGKRDDADLTVDAQSPSGAGVGRGGKVSGGESSDGRGRPAGYPGPDDELLMQAPAAESGGTEKRYSSFRSDLGKRSVRFRSDLGKRRLSSFRSDLGKRDQVDLDDAAGHSSSEEIADGGPYGSELGGHSGYPGPADELQSWTADVGGIDKRYSSFRSDLGKRSIHFRSDLGKRRLSTFRSDLGKRAGADETGRRSPSGPDRPGGNVGGETNDGTSGESQSEDDVYESDLENTNGYPADESQSAGGLDKRRSSFRSDLGKRSVRFRSDLGKRRLSAFRSDLGKRVAFRSDLGRRSATPYGIGAAADASNGGGPDRPVAAAVAAANDPSY